MPTGAKLVSLIPIRKMDRALKFYTKALGAKLIFRGRGEMKNYWADLKVGNTEVWFVLAGKDGPRKLAYHNFVVKNITSYVRGLQQKGVKFEKAEKTPTSVRMDGPITWEPFGGSAFFKDSEGNLLMVWQNIPPM